MGLSISLEEFSLSTFGKVGETNVSKKWTISGKYYIYIGCDEYEVDYDTYVAFTLNYNGSKVQIEHKGSDVTATVTFSNGTTLKRTAKRERPIDGSKVKNHDEYGKSIPNNYKFTCGFGIFSEVDELILQPIYKKNISNPPTPTKESTLEEPTLEEHSCLQVLW